ncbi:PREDICTED: 39S ribosomal protein L17, mitochondrial-like [Priapulus caudatus]|uniref:Large ribosomal subunit protein bL17m n=1 Tax=Priapulus caudatus TaxID=37621 RepID=A0ABM1EE32_PRICU|nr:PREDICTED: 39S ribosomal protein L17, mitochondrial-like [Priapulus caudatus]
MARSVPPRLKFQILPKIRNLSTPEGPLGRIKQLQKLVGAIIQYERIESQWSRADEARGYVERLIQEAVQNGPNHKPTMELANYWLVDKDLVHKLFKVLVPRFQNYTRAYTSMFPLPLKMPGRVNYKAVLELKGNAYPHVVPHHHDNHHTLLNQLLSAANDEYRQQKLAEKLSALNISMAQFGDEDKATGDAYSGAEEDGKGRTAADDNEEAAGGSPDKTTTAA